MHEHDTLLTITQATKISPGRPSIVTLWRWCRKGVRTRSGERVRLEHVRVGARLFTSRRWLEEFGQHVAAADTAHFDDQTSSQTRFPIRAKSRATKQRVEAVARARAFFQEAGL